MKKSLLFLIPALFTLPSLSWSAPLDLANQPLDITQGVDPNILFLIDDSGSMDFEVMTKDFGNDGDFSANQPDGRNAPFAGPIKNRDSNDDGHTNCQPYNGSFYGYIYGVEFASNVYQDNSLDCNTADDAAWRFRDYQFNTLYYDPNHTYLPWKGYDYQGQTFGNINIHKAPNNPYHPTEWIDLTKNNSNWLGHASNWQAERTTSDRNHDGIPDGFRYYTWVDKNHNGLFDNGEETVHFIKDASPEQQQNFANWFSYWRSRAFVVKGVLSDVLQDVTNVRVGFATINHSHKGVRNKEMNTSPSDGNKRNLLNHIFAENTKNYGTPLRMALTQAGQYYSCRGNDIFGDYSNSDPGDKNCPVEVAPAGTCQQNYTVLLTDGFYNGFSYWFGNQDASGKFAGGAFADRVSNSLADIAMDYYKNDLQPSLADNVPANTIDAKRSSLEKGDTMHQHMNTYTVGFGLSGNLDSFPSDYTKSFSWPNPFSGNATEQEKARIDDLRHAAYNGRGDYLSAQDPTKLLSSLKQIITQIKQESGTASAVAFNTQSISSNSLMYRAFYNTKNNTGDLVAQKILPDGTVSSDISWSASTQLDSNNNRHFLSYNGTKGISFDESNMNSTQVSELNDPYPSALPSNYGNGDTDIADERIAYLKGDISNEGTQFNLGQFRQRLTSKGLLGDIIHSTPVYVGTAPFNNRDVDPYPNATGELYSTFKESTMNREEMVYVGANDGMLHGFDANTGKEVFAYVPNLVYSKLSHLTEPDYTHEYSVDGTPAVNDIFMNNAWHSILIGGLNAGGRGYYALNITKPSQMTANDVLWEFSPKDDGGDNNSDLGYSFSTPIITMTNEIENGHHVWVAIFGNGYNSTSTDGDSALYILKIAKGIDGWQAGDFIKIKTPFGKATSSDGTTPNGLGQPRAVDIDGNGTVDYVYAGDLQGHLYRFDLTSNNSNNWNNYTLIYNATDSNGNPQPITTQPAVVKNSNNNPVVIFTTGSWMTNSDSSSTQTQSIYGVEDDLSQSKGNSKKGISPLVTQSDLIQQQYTDVDVPLANATSIRTLSNNPVEYKGNTKGWYINLSSIPGERAVRQLQIRNGVAYVNTVIPNNKAVCVPPKGGYELAFDPTTGGVPNKIVFDINNDGYFDNNDLYKGNQVLGLKRKSPLTDSSYIGNLKVTQLNDKSLVTIKTNITSDSKTGQYSWHVIQ